MKTLVCTKCNKEKSLPEFFKNKTQKRGYSYWCKQCDMDDAKQWRKNNPEKNKAYQRKARKKYPKRQKGHDLKRRFGISLEDYNEMFEEQQGRCAVCDKHQSEQKRALSVEHCHKTRKIRGLTCATCNHLISVYESDFYGLKEEIADYLKRNDA